MARRNTGVDVGYRAPATAETVEIGVVHDWETYVYLATALLGAAIAIVFALVRRHWAVFVATPVGIGAFLGYGWLKRSGNMSMRYRVLASVDEITVVAETWILPNRQLSARITRAT